MLEPRFLPAGAGPAMRMANRRPSGAKPARPAEPLARSRRRVPILQSLLRLLAGPLPGRILALGVLGATGIYGAVLGGHYAAFVAEHGEPADLLARGFGFGIDTITIGGAAELDKASVLEIAGITPRKSLLFLDAGVIRQRLESLAIVKRASVAKLYPDRLLITIEERRPSALWQQAGRVQVVAEDGTVLGPFDDQRFMNLPHVVGRGANARAGEYLTLLEAAGDLRERIRAAVLVSGRRWTLKTTQGIDIHLPETDAAKAIAHLVHLQRTAKILDKAVLSLDFRQAGRVVARLSAEAAAARAETTAQKARSKGGPT
jgi:cell division protein FtsQ